jgi:hypothetical protein
LPGKGDGDDLGVGDRRTEGYHQVDTPGNQLSGAEGKNGRREGAASMGDVGFGQIEDETHAGFDRG